MKSYTGNHETVGVGIKVNNVKRFSSYEIFRFVRRWTF